MFDVKPWFLTFLDAKFVFDVKNICLTSTQIVLDVTQIVLTSQNLFAFNMFFFKKCATICLHQHAYTWANFSVGASGCRRTLELFFFQSVPKAPVLGQLGASWAVPGPTCCHQAAQNTIRRRSKLASAEIIQNFRDIGKKFKWPVCTRHVLDLTKFPPWPQQPRLRHDL